MEQNSLTSVTLAVSSLFKMDFRGGKQLTLRKSGRSIRYFRLPEDEMQSSLVLSYVAKVSDPLEFR